jgi:hypothetical protein
MAKKKASRGEFNMSAAIRSELESNPNISLRECLAAVQSKYPNQQINENSFGVAFSNQRIRLGLSRRRGGRKSVRRRKPGAVAASRSAGTALDLDVLQAARKYVAAVGDSDKAIAAIRQLQTLQIS